MSEAASSPRPEDPARPEENPWSRFIHRYFSHRGSLSEGLDKLNSQLGLNTQPFAAQLQTDTTVKTPTANHARSVMYAPDMDGQADPGEVVWVDIRPRRGGEMESRAVLIIGRNGHTLLTLLISENKDHLSEDNWLPIGSGPWENRGGESWIRLDKLIEVPESQILRRGVSMPERRFDRISARLRNDYGWR
ncbi:type II toxin-antitoxin system PemK/MazF family toxin [Corynebacterium heidelbergense]|uniref:Growth inhibitor PemK n=1 Tax=Corynebacterium heidelbergense TaxID=2055947 RepID=A0A364VDE0_9CORY|nr:type II toxin-antitoxin system PemK/MazF family toxin [Corynebacterium heidelbergense]RAV34660.1 hypothetical protein CWC39_01915 [Corynebacterium heidelbergense]WCZ36232.1 PemK-like protein [Corynebacterium heidelbergense]